MKPFLLFVLLVAGGLLSGCGPKPPNDELYPIHQDFTGGKRVMCFAGDIGKGNDVEYAVAKLMHEQGCNDIRILGDIDYPSGIESLEDPRLESHFIKPYQPLLDSGARISLVLGNHDYKTNPKAWFEVAKKYGMFFPFYYYAEESDDGVCLFSLDTSWYSKLYFLGRRHGETAWLDKTAHRLADQCKLSIAMGHHFYRSRGAHHTATPLEKWFLSSEVTGRFDLYVAGHEHMIDDEGSQDGTHLLISGAGGANTGIHYKSDKSLYASNNYGFLKITFHKDDNGTPVADYSYHELKKDPGKPDNLEPLGQTHSGQVIGRGLRQP